MYRPSDAHLWMHCNGSIDVRANASRLTYETGSDDDANLGTAAAWFAKRLVFGMLELGPSPWIGDQSPAGIELDEPMFDAIQGYAFSIFAEITHRPRCTYNGEQLVTVHSVHPDCEGTPDFWLYDPDEKLIIVWDYKHGRGIVEAFENPQTGLYGFGLSEKFNVEKFDLRIYQPRAFHHDGVERSWCPTPAELSTFISSANRAANSERKCTPGPHCLRCRPDACEASAKACGAIHDYATQPIPREMTTDQAEVEYLLLDDAVKIVEARRDAVKARIKSDALRGERFKRLIVEQGNGNLTWDQPAHVVIATGELCGLDVSQRIKPKTPKQALDMGFPKSLVAAWASRKQTGLKIKPLTGAKIRRLFSEGKLS